MNKQTMAAVQDHGVAEALGSLASNLQLVIDQLKGGENTRPDDPNFDLISFWNRLGMTFKAISAESTKLTMAFSSPPCPSAKDAEPLISGLEKASLAMLSVFYSLPEKQGKVLQRKILNTILCILTSVQSLANIIKTEGIEGSKQQLQSTGGVWEYCDTFPNLPKNNKDAVLEQSRENRDLVKDALEEIEAAVDQDEEDDCDDDAGEDRWTAADRGIVAPSLGLLKASQSCCKKVTQALRDNGKCNDDISVRQLDELDDVMSRVSPAVDDFVLCLYPPLRKETVKEESQKLVDVLILLLNQAKTSHITTDADKKWIDFLTKAVHHNHEKVKQLLPE